MSLVVLSKFIDESSIENEISYLNKIRKLYLFFVTVCGRIVAQSEEIISFRAFFLLYYHLLIHVLYIHL